MEKILNYVNGELVEPRSQAYLDNIDPSIGKVYSQIPDSGGQDVELAVQAAELAQDAWAKSSIDFRSKTLHKIADLIDRDIELLARAESIDNGKPISLARTVDIPRASANLRFYASAIVNFSAKSHVSNDKGVNLPFKAQLVLLAVSHHGICLYIYLLGRLHLLWQQVIV